MELSLDIKQTQKLTPKMMQAMAILQMGTLELQEHVEKTLLENPALELESESRHVEHSELVRKLAWLVSNDRQNRWYHQEDARDLVELIADPAGETLYDYLRGQIELKALSARMVIAIDCVLTGLNHYGYLEETLDELAFRCGQPVSVVMQAERIVKGLDPPGVAARTLSECLTLQLERSGEGGLALYIVQNHLEDIAQKKFQCIAQATGATREEISTACNRIRSLEPRPGAPFVPREPPGYVVPDILVTEENGSLIVTPGDEFLPVLRVSSYYERLMRDTDEVEVRDYLTQKVRQAQWLIKSIEQRKNTMLNCARIIVRKQESFFRSGVGVLNPLSMAEVARELGVHESTVSRAIREKHIQCIRGVFPLSRFFSRSLPAGNAKVSPSKVKALLRELIDSEDKRNPLSDQAICDLMAGQEVVVSRRTIAKYRGELGIQSAAMRKEFY